MIREIAASVVLGVRHLVLWVIGASGWAETRLFRWALGIRQGRPAPILAAYATVLTVIGLAVWAVAR